MDESVTVSVIMGSQSDFKTMSCAIEVLSELKIAHEVRIVSAHRTPDRLFSFAKEAHLRGIKVIIAGAGGAAHLPGMVASLSPLPVLGVPIKSKALNGIDSLLSIAQMPGGIPVATLAIGDAGAKNAALLAAAILALENSEVKNSLLAYRSKQTEQVSERPQGENL